MTQATTNILLIILTAGIGFTFAMIKLGISRLLKGQDDARLEGMKRVNIIRDDVKNVGIKVQKHETRIAIIETRCQMHDDRRSENSGRRMEDG